MESIDLIKEIITAIIDFVKPWTGKSIGILIVSYGAISFLKRLTNHGIPKWLKACIPLILGVVAQAIMPTMVSRDVTHLVLYNIGIGLAHGAVLSSIYDTVLKNIGGILKDKISRKKA